MTGDARFEDGDEQPLRLIAYEAEDLQVISALVQDAIFPVTEMAWKPKSGRFAVLLNRFRWEDVSGGERRGSYERVQSLLVIDGVQKVATQGFDRGDRDLVLSLMSLGWAEGDAPSGRLELVLAGDGGIALDVEALEVTLKDVTRPYVAPSGHVPDHPD